MTHISLFPYLLLIPCFVVCISACIRRGTRACFGRCMQRMLQVAATRIFLWLGSLPFTSSRWQNNWKVVMYLESLAMNFDIDSIILFLLSRHPNQPLTHSSCSYSRTMPEATVKNGKITEKRLRPRWRRDSNRLCFRPLVPGPPEHHLSNYQSFLLGQRMGIYS